MGANWDFRAFTQTEHRIRIKRAQGLLAGAGIEGCVCTSPELIYYFTGYEAHTHHAIGAQAMVLATARDDPVLILRDGDLPQAAETLVIGTLRPFRLGATDLGELVKGAARDLGITGRPLASIPPGRP